MKIHHIISFLLDKGNGQEDGKLRMRVRWGKDNRVALNVGYRVAFSKWSPDAQRCKANTTHGKNKNTASEINSEIERYREAADEVFRSFESRRTIPTIEEYRESLRAALGRKTTTKGETFEAVYNRFVLERIASRSLSDATTDTMRTTKRRILKMYPDITISEMLDRSWMERYRSDMEKEGLKPATISEMLTRIKTFLSWLTSNGIADASEALSYTPRIKQTKKPIVWLTWDEFTALYEHDFTREEVDKRVRSINLTRDVFCLSAATGLRISDIERLKWSDITPQAIVKTSKKVGKNSIIELNQYSAGILDRRRADKDNIEPDYVFPKKRLSREMIRLNCQLMCKLLGFDEPITETAYRHGKLIETTRPKYECISIHCGRKTFICNMIEKGVNPITIMQWTGHANYESMKPYIAVSDKARATAMKVFDKKEIK